MEATLDSSMVPFITEKDFTTKIENYYDRLESDDDAEREAVLQEVVDKLFCADTMGKFVALLGAKYEDHVAFVDTREAGIMDAENLPSMSYRELAEKVESTKQLLAQLGVRHGTRVGILGENSPEIMVHLLACMALGAVAVPFASREECGQVPDDVMEQANVEIIFADSIAAQMIRMVESSGRIATLRASGLLIGITPDAQESIGAPPSRLSGNQNADAHTEVKDDHLAMLLFTTGTTGPASIEYFTHAQLLYPALTIPSVYNEKPGKRTLQVMPFYHVYGAVSSLAELAAGAEIFLSDRDTMKAHPKEVLRAARPHFMPSVPYAWERTLRKIEEGLEEAKNARGIRAMFVRWIEEAIDVDAVQVARDDIALSRRVGMSKRDLKAAKRYWKPVLDEAPEEPQGTIGKTLATVRQSFGRLLKKKVLRDAGLENLRHDIGLGISGGGRIGAQTLARLRAIGLNVRGGYGLTQSSLTTVPDPHRQEPLTCSGSPIPGVSLLPFDHESGKHGLVVRGGTVAAGEPGKPNRGAFRTDDAASVVHTNGYVTRPRGGPFLYVGPRFGDVVKLHHGRFADLSKFKKAIEEVPGVAQAMVRTDIERKTLLAYIIPKSDIGSGAPFVADMLANVEIATASVCNLFKVNFSSIQILHGAPAHIDAPGGSDFYTRKGEPKWERIIREYSHEA